MKPSTLHSGIWVTVVCALLTVPPTAGIVRNANSGIYYPSITQAVSAAVNGDQLNVATGVYAEYVQIINKQLAIRGGYGTNCMTKIPNACSVISEPNGHGPYLSRANVYFSDMYVTGMVSFGLNVRLSSVVTCEYCAFLVNKSTAYGRGGGVCVRENSDVTLLKSLVGGNYAPISGGGAYVNDGSRLTLGEDPCELSGNSSDVGGGVAVDNATLIVGDHVVLRGNSSDGNGGAVFATNGARVVIAGPDAAIGYLGTGNTASNGRGGGVCAYASTIVISNGSAITLSHAHQAGGAIYADAAHVAIDRALLSYNTVRNDGGAVYLLNGSSLAATNASMNWNVCTNYSSSESGAIYGGSGGCNAYLRHCQIVSNVASSDGGGIKWWSDGRLDLIDCTVSHNESGDEGGAVYFSENGLVRVVGGEMLYNRAAGNGGAVFGHSGVLICEQPDIRLNLADADSDGAGDGGGICFTWQCIGSISAVAAPANIGANVARRGGGIYLDQGQSLVIMGSPLAPVDMLGNAAASYGGAIYAEDSASVAITGYVRIAQNLAANGNGGGIFVTNRAQLVCAGTAVRHPQLYLNSAAGNGGAISAMGSVTVHLDHVEIGREGFPNRSYKSGTIAGGGGVAIEYDAHLDAQNCRFAGNVSARNGGGLFLQSASAALTGAGVAAGGVVPVSAFVGNVATGEANSSGGGIYCYLGDLAVANTLFASNLTHRSGGAVQFDTGSEGNLVNLVVSQNAADMYGGGVRVYSSPVLMRHCTVANNYTNGIECSGSAALTLSNCIVWGHTGLQVSAGHEVHYSDIEGGYPGGTHCMSQPPLFADWENMNYQLTAGSPCTNAGADVGVYVDCIGMPRPRLGGFDMGAYEFIPEPLGGIAALTLVIAAVVSVRGSITISDQ